MGFDARANHVFDMNNENAPRLKVRLAHWCFKNIPSLFRRTNSFWRWQQTQQAPVLKGASQLVLVCDVQTPRPDHDSGSMDTANYMRMLLQLGYQIVFFPTDIRHDGPYTSFLEKMGIQALYYPMLDSLEDHLDIHGHKYDLVLLNRAQEYPDLANAISRSCSNARIIFNTVDLHFLRLQRQAELENSASLFEKSRQYKEHELNIMRLSHAAIVISATEKKLLEREMPDQKIVHIPFIREIQPAESHFSNRRDIIFIGGFAHPPNVDAIHYFVDNIWQAIRAELPDVNLLVVGSNTPESILELGRTSGIDVLGFVENVSPLLHRCRLSIAPLRYGAGIKGKVGTSLAHGLPCVASPVAAEGMGLTHNRDIMIASTDQEFSESVISTYKEEDFWKKVSQNGINLMHDQYSFSAGLERFEALIDGIRKTPKNNS